jgi:hypothetical protein
MNETGKVRALLATARLPNIPSVISNVWFGVALGLSRKWLCGPRLAAGTAFSAAPK